MNLHPSAYVHSIPFLVRPVHRECNPLRPLNALKRVCPCGIVYIWLHVCMQRNNICFGKGLQRPPVRNDAVGFAPYFLKQFEIETVEGNCI